MQDQSKENANKSDNIVSLFAARQEAARKTKTATTDVSADSTVEAKSEENVSESDSFGDLMRKNAENDERLRKERLKANSSVLKSYRIKN